MKIPHSFSCASLFVILASILFSACKKIDPSLTHEVFTTATPYTYEEPYRFPPIVYPADNPMTLEGIALGRNLFYAKNLSIDNSKSCGTCHKAQDNFAEANVQYSTNVHGATARNAMPLMNAAWSEHFFWDGRSNSIEEATLDAAHDELAVDWNLVADYVENNTVLDSLYKSVFQTAEITKENLAKAISQFIRTMNVSGESRFDVLVLQTNNPTNLSAAELRGYEIFTSERGDCFHCHFSSPLMTDNIFHNNALDSSTTYYGFEDLGYGNTTKNQEDNGKFKTPSLINVAYTAPYMHDGRFNTLREVIDHYSEGLYWSPTVDPLMKKIASGGLHLTESEKDDLEAFLMSLTDSTYMSYPLLQDPF